jgi:phosphate/sulfate permease
MLILGATVVGVFAVMAYGMTSPDRKEVMIAILSWPFFGILGWLLAFAIFFVCRYTHSLRDKTHTIEMNRIAEVKNQAVQAALPFELKSSESTPTESQ